MKEQEAIKNIKTLYPKNVKKINGILKGGFEDHDCVEGQALDMAVSALEKQIPKKPIIHRGTNRADCPACNATVRGIQYPFGNWCSNCGQKLDWSE